MTLLPTVEEFSLKLQLLGDSPFRSQLRALPFVVASLELGTLTMFHKSLVSLGLCAPFLLDPLLSSSNVNSNNHIFDALFLSLMLKDENIVFNRYIDSWILRIYKIYRYLQNIQNLKIYSILYQNYFESIGNDNIN